MNRLRVLLLDDNPYDRKLIIRELEREFGAVDVVEIHDDAEFVTALESPCADVVITDYQLRWTTGIEVMRQVKARCPHVPVIMFTGTADEEVAVEAMKAGLDDYIVKKPKHFKRLSAAVRRALDVVTQRRQVQALEQEYHQLFEQVPVGVFRIPLPEGTVRGNAAMMEIFGVPADMSVKSTNAFRFAPSEQEYQQFIQDVTSQGEVKGRETQALRLDGTPIWVRVSARAVRDEQGRVYAIDGVVEDITLEREQQAQLHLLTKAMEATANAIVITDVKGTILWVNPAFTRMTGYTLEEAYGKNPRILKSGQHDRAFYEALWQTILAGRAWHGEIINKRKDGTLYVEEMTITPVRDKAGHITHFIAIKQDITHRKRVEGELQHVNRTLRLVSRAIEAVLRAEDERSLLQDVVNMAVEVGGYVLAWIGYPDEGEEKRVVPIVWAGKESGYLSSVEISWADTEKGQGPTGRAIRERRAVVCQDILNDPKFTPWREQARRRGYASSAAIPIIWKGNVLGVLNVYATEPYRFDEEEVRLLTALAEDVAYGLVNLRIQRERDTALEEARQQAERLQALNQIVVNATRAEDVRSLLEDTLNALVRLFHVPMGAIWTKGECVMFGVPQELAQSMSQLAREHGLDIPHVIVHQDMKAEPLTPSSGVLYTRFGMRSAIVAPITTHEGRIGAVAVADHEPRHWSQEDIGLLKAVGHQIGSALSRLHLIEQLRETNQHLQEALCLRDEMIQNVSHELRTPLTIIMGYMELAQAGEFGELREEQQNINKIVLRNAQRLRFMVERLLLLRTLPEKELRPIRIHLQTWLSALAEDWRLRTEEAHIRLKVEIAPGTGPILADARLLEEVINNLIHNAVKFSPSGGTITLSAWHEGQETIIAVSDEGVGIPPEKLERIWERFYQIDQGTTRRYEGMGIGLALCKEIVEKHGGRIWAESAGVGKGSTFYVALPDISPGEERTSGQAKDIRTSGELP